MTIASYMAAQYLKNEELVVNFSSTEVSARWARFVSNVISPPMVWAVMGFIIAVHSAKTQTDALVWALTYSVPVCLLPILYIAWEVRRGNIGDIHMKERHERTRPFLVSIICTALAWVLLRLMGTPDILPLVAGVTMLQLTAMAVITLVWQISMHAMSISVAVVATGVVFGPATALAVFPLVPIVGAARLKLHRHTLAQVIAGAAIGALIPLVVLAIQ
ncbi:MAG: hypothetical protein R3E39_13955 [Anaerolineae bacterium]